jgi:hypothetical protein
MILAHYFWKRWGTDFGGNGFFVILILAVVTAILIYTIDFLAKKIRKKNSSKNKPD